MNTDDCVFSQAAKVAMGVLGVASGRVPAAARPRTGGHRGPLPRGAGAASGEPPDGATPTSSPSPSSGGLGEIGRNCAAIEVEGRIMLLDCGLMFPDADMLGVDLVLPDFTWLREHGDRIEGCIVTHGHEDHMGGLSFLLRELSFPIFGSALSPGPGAQPHRGGRPARPHRADPGRGQRASQDRPVRLRVHPRHPLGAPRLRHRLPHAAGHDPAQRGLQARSDTGRRSPHRPRRHGRHRPERRRPAAAVGLHQRRPARPLPLGDLGRQGAGQHLRAPTPAGGSSPPASPATSTASSRSPTRPSPTAASWPPSACR